MRRPEPASPAHPRCRAWAATALAIASVCVLAASFTPAYAESAGAGEDAPRAVISEIVTAEPLPQRSYPGTVTGSETSALAFQAGGRLATLMVRAGDMVAAGDVLATLDEISLHQQVLAAQAAYDSARAEAQLAESRHTRALGLLESEVMRRSDYERLLAARDATSARAEAAAAELGRAEEVERYGVLIAPHDAIILSTMVEPGATVVPGSPVLTIADPIRREAIIDVPAPLARLLEPGTIFEVARVAGDAPPVIASLQLVEPRADTGLETRRLRLALAAPPDAFRIGSLVSATYSGTAQPIVTLPLTALVTGKDSPAVWRVRPADRRAELVAVTLGEQIGARVVIAAGLEPGDEIITRGSNSLHEGEHLGPAVEIPLR